MAEVLPLPRLGEVFADTRPGARSMRVSFHAEVGLVVVSVWTGGDCRASCRLTVEESKRLAALLGQFASEGETAAPAKAAVPDAEPPAVAT
jgi:hypothetical protein